ncbi:hypothetical protein BCON_0092g00150 [Botryotinia convoluta]|uniref:ABC transporter domain-containing protein n=1 Tax=Botryotinia convoluta TaxID=54673 RepID=A0A4Z1I7M5_9HELO|nr:hypothetical protein BCON_0092g00150 [Botryotinia convoluta]
MPTTTLDLLAAVTIVPLSHLEQYRSVKPSTFISLYLAFSAGLDIPRARTLYDVPGQLHLAIVFSFSLAARIALLCLEAWDRRVFLMEQYQTLATEATSGQDASAEKSMESPSMTNLIAWLTSLMLFWIFQSDVLEEDIGYGLIGATACIYLGIAISNALFRHHIYRNVTMIQGSLVSLIYTKSLSIKDQIDDPSSALTLMSTDVDRICQSVVMLHDLWSRPLELILGIVLLAFQIGWACTMPLAVIFISAILDSRVTLLIEGKVKIWSDAVQQRISLTADVLSSMKSVKMLGMIRPLSSLLQKERKKELTLQAKFRWSTVWLNTLAFAPAVTFIVYAIKARVTNSSSLNISQVFTSLALINLVTTPASELITSFLFAASCLGCVERIQEHLRRPDRLTMILGLSGSGKSTLLRAILGETKYSGTISINASRIAYCPQTAWLFTGTIRQNICSLEVDTFDDAWYRSVLYACVLDEMILGLSNGDNTLVEGQSSGLSGGQKQRLNIARALYHQPQLILFDDVLSALDMKAEIQIMTRLFGRDGLISKLGATTIFVTHSIRWETIADNVITLDGSGNAAKYSKTPDLQAKVLPTEFDLRRSVDLNSSDNVETDHIFDSLSTGEDSQALDASNGRISETQALSEAHIVDIPLHESDSRAYWAADHGSNEEKWLPTYLILAIGNEVMYGCTAWIMFLKLVLESAANLHLILLDVVMNAPYSFFTKTDIRTILNRFSQDMTLIESQLPTGNFPSEPYHAPENSHIAPPQEPNLLSSIPLPHNWPEHGTIEIRNLNASYNPSTLALNNITLSIHAGEKIGFRGRSGSGKSPLLSSLLRLLEPSSGTITIDGIDLSNINHQTLRERLLTVPQDAFLIQQTIRYNLDPLTQYTDPQLIAALQKVHLWSLFSPLNGLNTIASSNFLSQG